METSAETDTSGELLGWFLVPILAFVVVFLVSGTLPHRDCGSNAPFADDGPERALVIGLITALAMAFGYVAAARARTIRRERDLSPGRSPLLVIPLVAVLAAGVALFDPLATAYFVLSIFGASAAAIALVAMTAMLLRGWRLPQAGFWVPIYVGASGLFVYPLVGIVALSISHHPICFE